MAAREIIAKRLTAEIERRGFDVAGLARASNVPEEVIGAYLRASREVRLPELQELCGPLGLNIFRLLSKNFSQAEIHFRGLSPSRRQIACQIEDVFLKIKGLLPRAIPPRNVRVRATDFSDRYALIAAVLEPIRALRANFGNDVLSLIDQFGIAVFSVAAGPDDFDACLLRAHPHYAICVNRSVSPLRQKFSLTHELAHFLFDRDKQTTLELFAPNLYANSFSGEEKPEFVATKFAQFLLLDFEVVESLCTSWDRWPACLDLSAAQGVIREAGVSTDVLVNALHDVADIRGSRVTYREIRDFLHSHLRSSSEVSTSGYVVRKTYELLARLRENAFQYSPVVLSELETFLT